MANYGRGKVHFGAESMFRRGGELTKRARLTKSSFAIREGISISISTYARGVRLFKVANLTWRYFEI